MSTICGDPARAGDMTTTRSDRNTASGIECVTKTTAALVSRADPDAARTAALARHLVQRAERLVHQQQRRAARERAGDRHALLHAARQLARAVLGEVGQADELEQLERLRPALRLAGSPCRPSGSSTLRRTVRHSSSPACWKAMP